MIEALKAAAAAEQPPPPPRSLPPPSSPPPPPALLRSPSPPPPPPAAPKSLESFFRLQVEIEEAIGGAIQQFDPHNRLQSGDVDKILGTVANRFLAFVTMEDTKRIQLDEQDRKFIETNVWSIVQPLLDQSVHLRFQKGERVVCNVGSEWLSGSIAAINEKRPQERETIPYVVKLDLPGKLFSAPCDDNDTIRAEICFGRSTDGVVFTLYCLPQVCSSKPRRFAVGERVACAVEDCIPTPTGTVWAAGTVLELEVSMGAAAEARSSGRKWGSSGVPCAAYRVQIDAGYSVLVHKDEHWLIRDLAHQAEGVRQGSCGSRCLSRMEKRQREDGWETIDHMTRRVRKSAPPDADELPKAKCC